MPPPPLAPSLLRRDAGDGDGSCLLRGARCDTLSIVEPRCDAELLAPLLEATPARFELCPCVRCFDTEAVRVSSTLSLGLGLLDMMCLQSLQANTLFLDESRGASEHVTTVCASGWFVHAHANMYCTS